MEPYIKMRTLEEAREIIATRITLRELAEKRNMGKSTIHKDMQIYLKLLDEELYQEVQKIFRNHLEIRHLRGGQATAKKYQKNKIK